MFISGVIRFLFGGVGLLVISLGTKKELFRCFRMVSEMVVSSFSVREFWKRVVPSLALLILSGSRFPFWSAYFGVSTLSLRFALSQVHLGELLLTCGRRFQNLWRFRKLSPLRALGLCYLCTFLYHLLFGYSGLLRCPC